MKNLTTPCCDAPLTLNTHAFGRYENRIEVESIGCLSTQCSNSWSPTGVAKPHNNAGHAQAEHARVEHLVGRTPGLIIGANPSRENHYYILWEGDHSGTINSHSELDFERI